MTTKKRKVSDAAETQTRATMASALPLTARPRRPNRNKQRETPPYLDNYGIDLTKAAEGGKLDPVVGREKEIERIAQILSRRKKNNPILIGEPGVGKSAIAEGLALRIVEKRMISRVPCSASASFRST